MLQKKSKLILTYYMGIKMIKILSRNIYYAMYLCKMKYHNGVGKQEKKYADNK